MRSRQSRLVDRLLSVAMAIRRGLLRGKHAVAWKQRQNSRPYLLKKSHSHRFGINTQTMCGTTVCNMGSGNNCILYLHGGTYVDPPTSLHFRMLRRISQLSGWRVVLPIYDRAPIGTAQTVVPKMHEIYAQLCSTSGIDNIVIMGDSAGGGLALALCEYILQQKGTQPNKMILICPWLDVTMSNPDIAKYIDSDKMLRINILKTYGSSYDNSCQPTWLANPIHNITAGLAPIELFIGSCELLLSDCLVAKTLADKVGVDMKLYEFANMQHVYPMLPIPESIEAQNMIIQLLQEVAV